MEARKFMDTAEILGARRSLDSESRTLLLSFAFFLATNLLTISNWPVPWSDEIMYADPAINLAAGRGLTSGTWYLSHATDRWANNTPLYVLLLTIPAALGGDSLVALRSVNLALACTAVFVLWLTAKQTGWVDAPWRILLVALGLGGYGILFCYRSIRPDCINMLICALVQARPRRHPHDAPRAVPVG
jgi:hypothetical protein